MGQQTSRFLDLDALREHALLAVGEVRLALA
jgi:hypothetical protein